MYRGNDIIKIYDENFRNIGTSTREEVHTKGLLHQVAHVWMLQPDFDTPENSYVLFQKRSLKRDLYPGKYDLIQTTHFNPDESYEDAIVTSMEYYLGSEVERDQIHHIGTTRQIIDEGIYHDNALVQVFVIEIRKILFLLPATEAIIKVKYTDFVDLAKGKKTGIQVYSLDNTPLGETGRDEWWIRMDEFNEVLYPYVKSKIEELFHTKYRNRD